MAERANALAFVLAAATVLRAPDALCRALSSDRPGPMEATDSAGASLPLGRAEYVAALSAAAAELPGPYWAKTLAWAGRMAEALWNN